MAELLKCPAGQLAALQIKRFILLIPLLIVTDLFVHASFTVQLILHFVFDFIHRKARRSQEYPCSSHLQCHLLSCLWKPLWIWRSEVSEANKLIQWNIPDIELHLWAGTYLHSLQTSWFMCISILTSFQNKFYYAS